MAEELHSNKFIGSRPGNELEWFAFGSCSLAIANRSLWSGQQALESYLSDEERRQAERLADTTERWHFASRRVFQRRFLGRFLHWDQPLSDLPIAHQPDGRPFTQANPMLCLSFSTAGPFAAAAASPSNTIGIDIEAVRAIPDCLQLAQRFFHNDEASALTAIAPEQQSEVFIRLWSAKEACLKVLGTGMVGGPQAFQFTFDGNNIALAGVPATENLTDWSVHRLSALPGYVLFLAEKQAKV